MLSIFCSRVMLPSNCSLCASSVSLRFYTTTNILFKNWKPKKRPLKPGYKYLIRLSEKFPLTGKCSSAKRGKYYAQIRGPVQSTGYYCNGRFWHCPDAVPEIVVPDLTDFKLQPYVSYRVPDVIQSEFTSKDLFDACYAKQIIQEHKKKRDQS